MVKRHLFFCCLFFCFCLREAYAFQHEVALGYGFGKEVEQRYHNHGVVLSGKIYKFQKIDDTLIATIDGTLADIDSQTQDHNHLVVGALALAMRAYFADPAIHTIRPYLQASFGPAYLSAKQLGNRSQGGHVAFQSTLEVGSEIGNQMQSIDFNLRFAHYCNAGLFHPNEGINLATIVSIGYQF